MAKYIYQYPSWPRFTWDEQAIQALLGSIRHLQGKLLGQMSTVGFSFKEETNLTTLTLDVLKSSEIEGEILNYDQVRSSIARKQYYEVLQKTQSSDGNITAWLEWYLNCLYRALQSTETTISNVLHKADFWDRHKETELNARQRLMLNKLLDGFDGKLTSSKWAKIAKTSPDTALRDIQDLMTKGILRKEAQGGRSTNYELDVS